MELGRLGIWTSALDHQPAREAQRLARHLEEMGFGSIWFPEAMRREAFTNAGLLLAGTERTVVATGIANIYGRDPMTMASAWKTLTEAYPERFLLGLGVSHVPTVEAVRGHTYGRPVPTMAHYLDQMHKAPYQAAEPTTPLRLVLAALGPRMLALAARRSDGAHTYFVPVEHTRQAREILGQKWLIVEQAVVLEEDAQVARRVARTHTVHYLKLQNYTQNLIRLGYSPRSVEGEGDDQLVDDLVAWGAPESIAARIEAQFEAGADHVLVQVITATPTVAPVTEWEALARLLL